MIISLTQLCISLFSLVLFIFLVQKWLSGTLFPTQRNVPRSPRKLPIIGNLHQLGKSPPRSLRDLSKHYGPLMLLHFGRAPVLVASSAEAAKEIMRNQDAIFANRPNLSIPSKLSYGSRGLGFTPYGEYWRQVRSITVLHLLSNKKVRSYSRVREEETSAMVEKIRMSSAAVVNLHGLLFTLSNDIVCRVALGKKYEEDEKFNKLVGDFMEIIGATCLRDYIPWFGWILDRVNGLDARVESVVKRFDVFLESVIKEHRDEKKVNVGDGEMDLVDTLLEYQKENASVSPVEDGTIKALILDMFVAGTDTSSITLEWGLSELIKNPRTMRILENEVRRVVGSKREISDEDIEKMPYLRAVIKETLRLHPPAPLLIPRESMEDTRVMGYDISAGTQVLINAWAIGRDPSLWDHPEEFRPERFLDSSVDFKGMHFELIPFGSGRRGCPGIAFGVAVVELALAKLMQNFNFALPNGSEDLDMSESIGIGVWKTVPLLVTVSAAT